MKTRRVRVRLGAVAVVAGIAIGGMLATASAESTVETTWRPDAWITAKTKLALAVDPEAGATYVDVDTVNGRVTLHGKVYDEAEKMRAEKVARGIEGAVEVRNLLQIVPQRAMEQAKRADAVIQDAVDRALKDDRELASSSVYVQSVHDGVVLLAGEADSVLAHLQAIRTASRVEGVRSVQTEAETGDRLYDESLWHDPDTDDVDTRASGVVAGAKRMAKGTAESTVQLGNSVAEGTKNLAAGAAKTLEGAGEATADLAGNAKDATVELGRNVKDGTVEMVENAADASKDTASATSGAIRDAWITTAAKSRLLADPDAPALSINVDTSDGIVTLFGTVPSEKARRAALAEARAVSGVREVQDSLKVDTSIAKDASATALDDVKVQANVTAQLEEESRFRGANIDVAVEDGVVELNGTAPNGEVKLEAAMKARGVEGVRAVRNHIRISADLSGRIGG